MNQRLLPHSLEAECAVLGSIFGTLVTGFLLVSWFSTHVIVWGVGGLLLLLGLLFLLRHR